MLELYEHYRNGHLPVAGGAADQPYMVMQAFRVIGHRRNENAEKAKPRGKKTPR